MLPRCTVTICVSRVAVGGNWRFLSGRVGDIWRSIFRLGFYLLGVTIVIFSAIATVWDFGRGFCS